MTISYDPTLVMLAMFVAITGAITGLTLTAGYDQRYGRNATLTLIKGAIAIGGSIWLAHFVAMLAVRFPIPVNYNFVETMVSLYAVMIGTGLALFIARGRHLGAASGVVGGTLMGVTIVAMHYMGMAAIRGCSVEHAHTGGIVAATIAVVASIVALWFVFQRRGTTETLLGGLMLGLTIPSVHLTAMGATSFHYLHALPRTAAPFITPDMLTFVVVSGTVAICGTFLLLFAKLTLSGIVERRIGSSAAQPGPFDRLR